MHGDELASGQKLLGEPNVRAVVPEFLLRPLAVPNDLPSQVWWTGSNTINAQGAWNTQTGSRQVIIAVVDTGVDLTHPDLVNNFFINEGELPTAFTVKDANGHKAADFDNDGVITYADFNAGPPAQVQAAAAFLAAQRVTDTNGNGIFDPVDFLKPGNGIADGIDSDGNGFIDDITGWNFQAPTDASGNPTGGPGNSAQDVFGHGTYVAGLAGAVGNNGIGIPGIAWQTRILPVRMAGPDGVVNGHTPMLNALAYAQKIGATVINMSFGQDIARKSGTVPSSAVNGSCKLVFQFSGTDSQFDAQVTQFTKEWTDNGITLPVVLPVSDCPLNYDSGKFWTWPASVAPSNAIIVTATNQSDQIASFAGFGGSLVQIGAPGQSMWGPLIGGGTGAFRTASGTSFAAPLVTGTIALMVSQRPSLAGNPSAIFSRLTSNADKTGIATSGGRLNVNNAVTAP